MLNYSITDEDDATRMKLALELTIGPIVDARFLDRSLASEFSAMSALSFASSTCVCSCLYLPKFTAATSSLNMV